MITPTLQSFGQLAGVAPSSDSAGDPQLNFDWFKDPRQSWDLHKNSNHWATLYNLISVPLGTRVPGDGTEPIPSPFDSSVKWFTVPKAPQTSSITTADQSSGIYVAMPATAPTDQSTNFAISMGLQQKLTLASSTLTLFAELPVLEFPEDSDNKLLVFGKADHPLLIGAQLSSSDGHSLFTLDQQTYKGLKVLASLDSEKPPSVIIQLSEDGNSFSPHSITFADFKSAIESLLAVELSGWLALLVPGSQSYGTLLQHIRVLASAATLNSQSVLEAITLTSLLDGLFTCLFQDATGDKIQLLKAGADSSQGIFLMRRKNAGTATDHDYGLSVTMKDILLPFVGTIDQFLLQIGKDIGKDKGVEWTKSGKAPGLSLFLITSGSAPKVAPELDLVSIGYDYLAKDDALLLQTTKGFSLKGFLSRVYLSEAGSSAFVFGAAGKVLKLTIPLSGLAAAAKTKSEGSGDPKKADPVPQKLLEDASRKDDDDKDNDGAGPIAAASSSAGKKESAEKPKKVTFGFSAALDANQEFDFQLYDDDDKRTDTIWFPIDKGIGGGNTDPDAKDKKPAKSILEITKIGVEWKNESRTLGLLISGNLNVGLVKLSVFGFGIEIPVTDPRATGLTLDGAQVTLAVPSEKFELSGGLVRSKGDDGIKYIGELMFKVDTFAFTLFAGFGNAPQQAGSSSPGASAMFVFLRIDYPFGGPEEFFLNGICGGFGYNMLLATPSITDLPNFPLITGTDPDPQKNPFTNHEDSPLDALAQFLQITPGEYWVAVGVIGTTYKICNSTIILAVEFGNDPIVELLGLSTIRLPEKASDDDTIVLAQMALRAVYDNNLGVLGVEAQLVKGSYVLSRDLELSGGFAMFFWVKHTDKGPQNIPDFVISLGGYSPYFSKPKHYPSVDRVGIKYKKSDNLTIKGGYYFAITPSAVMAGGYLNATYTSDSKLFKAWFNAEANFLLSWKPLAYHIGVAVSIGASLTISVFGISKTISATIGASLDLWGQPFGGQAQVDLYLFSVTISFGGDSAPQKTPVPWPEFRDAFVADGDGGAAGLALGLVEPRTNASAAAPLNSQFLLVKVVSGLAPNPKPDATFLGMIRGEGFAIELATKVPVKKLTFNQQDLSVQNTEFGVGPAAIPNSEFQSALTATLNREGVLYDNVNATPVTASAPKALWLMGADPLSSDTLLPNISTGILLTPKVFKPDRTVEIEVGKLLFNSSPFPRQFDWRRESFPTTASFPQEPWQQVLPTIDAQKAERDRILAALGRNFVLPSALTMTADYGAQLLEDPEYRLLGEVKTAA